MVDFPSKHILDIEGLDLEYLNEIYGISVPSEELALSNFHTKYQVLMRPL